METKQPKSAKEKGSKETARAAEKLTGEARTARSGTGTAPKGSGPVTAGEGENTAKPPPAPRRNKGANKTQTSKSNTSGKDKTMDPPLEVEADRSSSLAAIDINERLNKLENLVEKFVAGQQAQREMARGHGSHDTDFNTQYHSHGDEIPPERGDESQFHSQYSNDEYGEEYDRQFDEEMETELARRAGDSGHQYYQPGGDMARNRTPTQSHSQGASLLVGQIQGQLQDDSTPSASEVPAIAAKFAIPSGIGKPINKQLASNIEYLTTHPLDEKNLSDTASKYPSPDNCPTLDVPKVNGTIWENLKGYTRTKDLKLQRVQKALAKGLTAFSRSVDGQDLTGTQQDTLALLCNAQFELNCLRRDCIRPDINPKYSHLCKASNVLTPSKQLFGDDLSKQVKDLQEEHKAAFGVVKGGRGPPYGRERRQYKPYPETNRSRYHDAGWHAKAPQTAQRPFLGPASGSYRAPYWKRKAPHTQTQPPSSDNKGRGRGQNRN